MKITCLTGILILLFLTLTSADAQVYLRVNQAGYLPGDNKIAIAFTDNQVRGSFKVIDLRSGKTVLEAPLKKEEPKGWGNFNNYFKLDFSQIKNPSRYRIMIPPT